MRVVRVQVKSSAVAIKAFVSDSVKIMTRPVRRRLKIAIIDFARNASTYSKLG